ncbi:MAG: hypothetical protein ACFB2Z_03670 [Maricaulaceae bacterium]
MDDDNELPAIDEDVFARAERLAALWREQRSNAAYGDDFEHACAAIAQAKACEGEERAMHLALAAIKLRRLDAKLENTCDLPADFVLIGKVGLLLRQLPDPDTVKPKAPPPPEALETAAALDTVGSAAQAVDAAYYGPDTARIRPRCMRPQKRFRPRRPRRATKSTITLPLSLSI